MYVIFGIFLAFAILFFFLGHRRKCAVIRKICSMEVCDKICLLNELMEPFGFAYQHGEDAMTSRVDAWQREFGYCALYDQSAVHFGMVFDCEPIYFDYQGHTWLIEFWKGQYGICAGGEIGIYQHDDPLNSQQYPTALFQAVPDSQLLPISMRLRHRAGCLFSVGQNHWWLTGFRVGIFTRPEELEMTVSITFPDRAMLQGFTEGLLKAGYRRCDVEVCRLTATFTFANPHSPQPRASRRLAVWFSQWKNHLFCRIYHWITRPYSCTLDRILYLYYFLPFTFCRLCCFKKNKKQRFHRKR